MTVVVKSLEQAKALEGKEIGLSNWMLIDQARIDKFAEATDDFQWIHTDPERAAKEFELGTTCAHGYLTLSLIATLIEDVVVVEGAQRIINFGINKARFRSMVPSGSQVRLRTTLKSARKRAGALQAILQCSMEMEGQMRPVLTAELVVMYFADWL
jgi:acyl dehydratase